METIAVFCAAIAAAWTIVVCSASSAIAAASACTSSGLRISLNRNTGQNFTSHTVWAIVFKNVSGHACTLRGYPGVSAITAAGKQIGPAASRDGGANQTITVGVGKKAKAFLAITEIGVISDCRPVRVAHLRVFAPNTTTALLLPFNISVCSHAGVLQIRRVQKFSLEGPSFGRAGVSAPAVVAQAPVCTENHLVITFGATSSATGHEGDVVRFINLGPDCTLRGYPGVDGLSATGQVLVHARRTPRGFLGGLPTGHSAETVNLATGSTASAILEGLGVGFVSGPCPRYHYVRVTPPGSTTSIGFTVPFPVCSPEIHPVVPGATGRVGE